jgi:hypothetical protein
MKGKKLIQLVFLSLSLFIFNESVAQCDTIASLCNQNITSAYISDGQQYRALLLEDEVAEFQMTLYGGSTYRMSACSGLSDGNLVFSVFDKERNLLFSNNEYEMAPFWDFKVSSTLDCIVEAKLNPDAAMPSGCAVLLVSFKP